MLSRKLFAAGCAAVAAAASITLIATRVTAQSSDRNEANLNSGECARANDEISLWNCRRFYDTKDLNPCRSRKDRAFRVIGWVKDGYRVEHLLARGDVSPKNIRRTDEKYCVAAGILRN
jgi:hypothetical protein